MYYIYKIENEVNHKKYIGLTNNIARRRARHFTDLRCNRHDNSFMQKEFNVYGEENFSFNIEFEGDVTNDEISQLEIEYIEKYDSYYNGYNQNKGGNFGPSNGGSHLTKTDIFNILSALEFMTKPGQVLADMYDVSRTTISRIHRKINHNEIIEEYEKMPLEDRKAIYKIFCDSSQLLLKKARTSKMDSRRKLTKEQVFMTWYNYENHIIPRTHLAAKFNLGSPYTLDCIIKGISYMDYTYEYHQLTDEQKQKIASLFSNK